MLLKPQLPNFKSQASIPNLAPLTRTILTGGKLSQLPILTELKIALRIILYTQTPGLDPRHGSCLSGDCGDEHNLDSNTTIGKPRLSLVTTYGHPRFDANEYFASCSSAKISQIRSFFLASEYECAVPPRFLPLEPNSLLPLSCCFLLPQKHRAHFMDCLMTQKGGGGKGGFFFFPLFKSR